MDLLTFPEMNRRLEKKEDPFDLTVEKWTRIRKFSEIAESDVDFESIFDASGMIVPFCIIHQRNCKECPLLEICGYGTGKKFDRIMRVITAYLKAGDVLPKETLLSELDAFISELELVRAKNKGDVH
jgi:hypothetical protein